MRVVDPGHVYELDTLDGDGSSIVLRFVKRVGEHYPGNGSAYSGTTSQEVLRALIERTEYVNNQIPCFETEAAAGLLKAALALFESRAARVHGRILDATLDYLIYGQTCPKCGHIGCLGHDDYILRDSHSEDRRG